MPYSWFKQGGSRNGSLPCLWEQLRRNGLLDRATGVGQSSDPFERFEEQGGVTTSKADWAWLQHTLASLKPTGRAAVVLDTGAVTRGSGNKTEDREKKIRRWFVEQDAIEGVILLPDNLFYNTTAPGILVVSTGKNRSRVREKLFSSMPALSSRKVSRRISFPRIGFTKLPMRLSPVKTCRTS
jgi:hypothetical protein